MRELIAKWLTMLPQIISFCTFNQSACVPVQYHRLIRVANAHKLNSMAKLPELFSVFKTRMVRSATMTSSTKSEQVYYISFTTDNITMALSLWWNLWRTHDRKCLTTPGDGCMINHHTLHIAFDSNFEYTLHKQPAKSIFCCDNDDVPSCETNCICGARARVYVHCGFTSIRMDFASIGNVKRYIAYGDWW